MLAVTIGAGLQRSIGMYTRVDDPPVEQLARLLAELPPEIEGWWSGHLWRDNQRGKDRWLATTVVVLDLDYEAEHDPFPEHRDELVRAVGAGEMPGNIFHLTPHGARVMFVLDRPYSEKKEFWAASAAAQSLVAEVVTGGGYAIDESCTKDLARLFFRPNAKAKGVQRQAELVIMRREPYSAAQLIAEAQPAPTPAPAPVPVRALPLRRGGADFEQAAAHWVLDHPQDYPTRPGRCPVCGHDGCFHALPDAADRWWCFSTGHPDGAGIRGANGYHGDALDLEAHARGCKPVDVLRADGYFAPARPAVAAPAGNAAPAPEPEPTPSTPAGAFRPWRSRSYLTAVDIIEKNARDVLDGRRLEFNEMTGRIELGRQMLKDSDESRVRANIEARFTGGQDKNNNEIGLQLSLSDVSAAIAQVAHSRAYHPVREYLLGLTWDGIDRLDHVAADILNAADTPLNRMLIRKFFISAAARPIDPGCKVDTVLILVGEQGKLKSSFFRAISSPWFDDTAIDIAKKDAFEALRNAWMLEWAELESLLRARDTNSVKSFLSSSKDTYRPSYGRNVVEVKRSGIIVGSTNNKEFLSDETGARRFWPIVVGLIALHIAVEQRDQLWAEAVHRFRAGEPWWLSDDEERLLSGVHEEHRVRDAWEEKILSFAEVGVYFTTGEVLAKAIGKDTGHWTRSDEMRVSAILKAAGYKRGTDPTDRNRKVWRLK